MALRRLKDAIEELHENCRNANEEMVTSAPTNPNSTPSKQYVKWSEVRDFLLMAEEALRAKDVAVQRALNEARNIGSGDEVEFLLQEIRKISAERTMLQQRVQELMRANQSLAEEITLIRDHIEAVPCISPSGGFPSSDSHSHLQLAEEQARTTALENELNTLKLELKTLQMKSDAPQKDFSSSPRIRAGKNTNNKKKNKKW